MATVTVNTLEFVSALRALIPISKQATLYSGEKERNAATIAARITPAKKLALITGNSALIDTLQETVEAMHEDANQQGVMDAIETLKGFLGWAL